ncbi:alpha/beta fold hydrolase [Lapillicoccus jejuensis]|uniref:alpha/beta fold hydrolase n=1 Tax=Lapillicoccus jejuensis TaxID=402171 RepID=UPI0014776FE4|nr:alpha/beta hydrolase [Lapillicoccus jejuensis]
MSTPTPPTSPTTPSPSDAIDRPGPPAAPADGWHATTLEVGGRRLAVHDTGQTDRPALVLHAGTPSTFVTEPSLLEAADRAGVRLVTWARPGYRGSDRRPGRTVADVVDDARAVLDHLGIERCATLGHSGGGPHTLAMGALLPERVAAVACVAGVAPYDAPGLDWLAGMGESNVVEFGACLQGEEPLRALLQEWLPGLAHVTGAELVQEWRTLLPPVDVAVMTDELGEEFAAGTRWCLAGGIDGWLDDDLAFARPWGVDLGAMTVPVSVWQGSEDLMVPAAHGPVLVAMIPGAEARLLDGEGHLSIAAGKVDEQLAWLRDRLVERG